MPDETTKNRTARYQALPQKLKDIDAGLRELCEVITGGQFNADEIWGATAQVSISVYMAGLKSQIDPDLKQKITELLGGLPASSAVTTAIKTATDGLRGVVQKIESTTNDIGSQVDTRFQAFKALMTPHQPNNYTHPDGNFGFFPAIATAVTAGAANPQEVSSIMGPLNDVMSVVAAGEGVADLVTFATGTIDLLAEALKV